MGNNSSRTETINWDKIKTDNIETPTNGYLGSNANNLITKLNLPKDLFSNNLETETEIDLLDFKTKTNNLISLDLNSSTSPFISSEKYLSLSKKLQNNLNQLGGALDDESSTSDTEEEQKLKEKKQLKSLNLSDNLSYVSSSAHTSNNSEDNNDEDEDEDNDDEDNDDEEDDNNSNQTTPDNTKGKYKKPKSEPSEDLDDDEDDEDDEDDLDDDEELEGGSETVYSTTIDNEVNTSDINLV